MTEIEVAEKIVERGDGICTGMGISCDTCPAHRIRELNGLNTCEELTGYGKESVQWFKDFLKGAKGMNGIDKAEAKKRLDAIEEEARKLREIIEKGDRIVYSDNTMYVGIEDGCPYILIGHDDDDYFNWHSFDEGHINAMTWGGSSETGQGAIDQALDDNFSIYTFANTRKAFEFFLEHYKG